ncbi:hypothetical protein E0485_21330 [Paenibacillus albiflavus]|uniref:Uncharacterized protein n=1 Tax=Paenibacillus albiflavus TaxID=2545760 RepID=A0A4R4E3J9_9BACL|nr:hypothetical protein E0485_21330 [Paenibacillus albiflavus]
MQTLSSTIANVTGDRLLKEIQSIKNLRLHDNEIYLKRIDYFSQKEANRVFYSVEHYIPQVLLF